LRADRTGAAQDDDAVLVGHPVILAL